VGDILIEDMNKDGYLDLLISDNRRFLYWQEGSSDLSFENTHQIIRDLMDCSIDKNYHWHDVNNDGFKDLVFINNDYDESHLLWFENDGKGNFSLAQNLIIDLPKIYGNFVHFVDVNGDNLKDLVLGESINKEILIYLNEGNGDYIAHEPIDISATESTYYKINYGDLDEDGDSDLILVPYTSSANAQLILALNDGTGLFSQTPIVVPEELYFREIIIGDLNKDGLKDIFLQSSTALYWIENQGNGNFSAIIEIGTFDNSWNTQAQLKDFDQDGYLDIIANITSLNQEADLYLYENEEGLSFKTRKSILHTSTPINDWGFKDLDQDGDDDIIVNIVVVEGFDRGNQWLWYENKGGNHLGGEIPIVFIETYTDQGQTVVMEDVNYDGDNDLLVIDQTYSPTLFFVDNLYNLKLNITGYSFWDSNANGLYDVEEIPLTTHKTRLNPTANATFTNSEGRFFYSVYPGEYQLDSESSSLWELTSPGSEYHITVTGEEILPSYNFGFKPTRILPRVEPHLNSAFTRCNTQVSYYLTYSNTGTTIANGIITFEADELMTFVEATPPPDTVEDGKWIWQFSDLYPSSENKIRLKFQMPDFNSISEILETQATAQLFNENQELIYSKSTQYDSEVRCSYDPNDKLVRSNLLGQSEFAYIEDTIYYTIRFQNTGNDTAFNIRIEDVLDKKLDWTTFHPITASHDYRTELNRETGLATFYFDDILLPDSTTNEEESHGFVMFGIATLEGIGDKTELDNTASIFFDFNPPIITNTATLTLIEQVETNIEAFNPTHSIHVYPNPFSDHTTIEVSNLPQGNYQLQVMDILGRKLKELDLDNGKVDLERGDLESGLYLIRILESSSRNLGKGNGKILGSGKVIIE